MNKPMTVTIADIEFDRVEYETTTRRRRAMRSASTATGSRSA